jgi:hypothetical protein
MLLESFISITLLTAGIIINTLLMTTLLSLFHTTQKIEINLRNAQNHIESSLTAPGTTTFKIQLDNHHVIEYRKN